MREKVVICIVFVALLAGWDFSRHSIPLDELKSGGPPVEAVKISKEQSQCPH